MLHTCSSQILLQEQQFSSNLVTLQQEMMHARWDSAGKGQDNPTPPLLFCKTWRVSSSSAIQFLFYRLGTSLQEMDEGCGTLRAKDFEVSRCDAEHKWICKKTPFLLCSVTAGNGEKSDASIWQAPTPKRPFHKILAANIWGDIVPCSQLQLCRRFQDFQILLPWGSRPVLGAQMSPWAGESERSVVQAQCWYSWDINKSLSNWFASIYWNNTGTSTGGTSCEVHT